MLNKLGTEGNLPVIKATHAVRTANVTGSGDTESFPSETRSKVRGLFFVPSVQNSTGRSSQSNGENK